MARQLFLIDIDLNGNKLKNAALESLASAPETFLSVGRAYYNSEKSTIEVYDGSAWQTMLRVSDVTNVVTAGSSAPISSGAVASALAGVTSAMHFITLLDSTTYDTFAAALAAYKAAHTSYNEVVGDIMIYGIKEYIYDGSQWCELGNETIVVTSFAGVTGAITVRGSQSATGKINLSMSGNELQAELIMPIASDILMTGYTKAQDEAAITETDDVSEAIGKIEYKVDKLKEEVLKNEETTAQALNDLNDRINAIVVPGKYVGSITSDDGTHAITITAVTHKCGTDPLTSVYYEGNQVVIDQSIDASGNITLSWAESTTISAEHPLKVVIMG